MSIKVYEFKCKECGHTIESPDRDYNGMCMQNECISLEPMIRVYSVGGISFKGNGFHKNDYK